MIASRRDLGYYLLADKYALGRQRRCPNWSDEVWMFQRMLRHYEYYTNNRSLWSRPVRAYYALAHHCLGVLLGFTIPPNVFGPGLSIAHRGTIVVSTGARIGANCRLHVDVNIGTAAGRSHDAPIIGDNVYIGPGAKIFGPITIADGIAIGANSVVNVSFTEPGITIAGVPAKKVSDKGSDGLLIRGTELVGLDTPA